jgi:hypothetical protein
VWSPHPNLFFSLAIFTCNFSLQIAIGGNCFPL